ncbi:MAG: MBL fold metallo-hydrolase [Neisseriaceae bacterium]|nr:MAG: MBL fold metallo-hydrolase [Neisseriaceae bacterium]
MALKVHTIPVTSLMQNATIVWDEETKDCIISDMGGSVDKFLSFIKDNQLHLNAIWLTHGHFDHIQAVAEFLHKQTVDVLGPHHEDSFWIQGLPTVLKNYGFPLKESFTPTRWLKEGDQLKIGHYPFIVLEIPGHTPGHVVFYSEKAKLLIAGDVLFLESIGRTDLPKGNHQDLIKNIKNKLLILPEDTTVITGHGPYTTIGHEKKYNPFF